MTKNILMLAGGGGHTGYGYALAQQLHNKALLNFLVPDGDYLSYEKLRKFGDVDFLIKPREPKTPNYLFLIRLIIAFPEAFLHISRQYDLVISTGSNFCVPPAISAWLKGIPIVNIESPVRFTKASKTAQLLQPISVITALHWPEQRNILNGTIVGPLLPKPEIEPWNGGYILVTGGTFGHRLLFDKIVQSNLENVILQTGRINPDKYKKKHPDWKIISYSTSFHELLAGAELIVTHFGSTVLEAMVYKKHVVIVPNPEWTRTVGVEDAKCLAKKINAVVVTDITVKNIEEAIEQVRDKEFPSFPDGSRNLAKLIFRL